MALIKVSILLLVSIILVAISWMFLLGQGAESTLLDHSFHEKVVEGSGATLAIQDGIVNNAMSEMQEGYPDVVLDEVEGSLRSTFDEEWIEVQVLNVSSAFIDAAEGRPAEVTVPLEEKRAEFLADMRARVGQYSDRELAAAGISEEMWAGISESMTEDLVISMPEQDTGESVIDAIHLLPVILLVSLILVFAVYWALAGWMAGLIWMGGAMLLSGVSFLSILYSVSYWATPLSSAVDTQYPLILAHLMSMMASEMTLVPVVYSIVGALILFAGVVLVRRYA